MRILGLLCCALLGTLLIVVAGDFPNWGDLDTPASLHVSPYYIEHTMEDTSVPNIVTSVLADYRGYDTMFETIVVFCAGMACFFLLGAYAHEEPKERFYRSVETGVVLRFTGDARPRPGSDCFERIDPRWTPHDIIVSTLGRIMVPFIQIYALYVIAHGHHSPGGGFQGGVILGAAFILLALSSNLRTMTRRIDHKVLGVFSAMGVVIYAGVGALCLGMGSNFLDYSALYGLLGVSEVAARSLGILFVEVGVGLTVMATMVIIYNNVASAGRYEEGL